MTKSLRLCNKMNQKEGTEYFLVVEDSLYIERFVGALRHAKKRAKELSANGGREVYVCKLVYGTDQ